MFDLESAKAKIKEGRCYQIESTAVARSADLICSSRKGLIVLRDQNWVGLLEDATTEKQINLEQVGDYIWTAISCEEDQVLVVGINSNN